MGYPTHLSSKDELIIDTQQGHLARRSLTISDDLL